MKWPPAMVSAVTTYSKTVPMDENRGYRTIIEPEVGKTSLDRGCGQHFPRVGRYVARRIISGCCVDPFPVRSLVGPLCTVSDFFH